MVSMPTISSIVLVGHLSTGFFVIHGVSRDLIDMQSKKNDTCRKSYLISSAIRSMTFPHEIKIYF